MPSQTEPRAQQRSHHWFYHRGFDLGLFHLPIWLSWLVLFLVPGTLLSKPLPLWAWVSVILLVDVGHVWSTIFRTYWDRESRGRNRDLLVGFPLLCFVVSFGLYLFSSVLFWAVLAYIAVYHFIKQQYGITALYQARLYGSLASLRAKKRASLDAHLLWVRRLDKAAIYIATGFPVLYWHLHLPEKRIVWFSKTDFMLLSHWMKSLQESVMGQWVGSFGGVLFWGVWLASGLLWLGLHISLVRRAGLSFPVGKCMWVFGTYINWYLGIVYFNSPFAFTLTNVIAHGIPYYGLVYIYSENAWRERESLSSWLLARRGVLLLLFVAPIFFFSFWEEYLWDLFIHGKEHIKFFGVVLGYPWGVVKHEGWRAFWVALLTVPQATHYFLDGFLWKANERNPHLKKYLHL